MDRRGFLKHSPLLAILGIGTVVKATPSTACKHTHGTWVGFDTKDIIGSTDKHISAAITNHPHVYVIINGHKKCFSFEEFKTKLGFK